MSTLQYRHNNQIVFNGGHIKEVRDSQTVSNIKDGISKSSSNTDRNNLLLHQDFCEKHEFTSPFQAMSK